MANLKVELTVFADHGTRYDDDGNVISTGTLEEAIIAAAADKVLWLDVPDKAEAHYHRTDKIHALLKERIKEAVAKRVESFTLVQVDEQVRAVIAEGWRKTDEYGTPRGEVLTLKARVSEILNGKADSYSRESRIEKMAREAIEAALKDVYAKEIEAARVAFKAQIDGVLQAKLREQLAGALGLKA